MINQATDFNIRQFNTFRMDVCCNRWIEYTEPADLPTIFADLQGPYLSIGSGSNILFTGNYPGTILHSRILGMEMQPDNNGFSHIKVGAGVEMDALISQVCQSGLWGLENLSGIPGEVGASAVQNVGAYGVEAKDAIESVDCFDTFTRKFVTLSNEDCQFGYRQSLFKQAGVKGRYIITHVLFRLSSKGSPALDYGKLREEVGEQKTLTPVTVREAVMRIRREKLPEVCETGSAGSFFKNPVVSSEEFLQISEKAKELLGSDVKMPAYNVGENKIKLSAAWLIDRAGLKGATIGGAATWHNQPLVIVNKSGNATPQDVLGLEDLIIKKVNQCFDVTLSPEVEHVI
ncbi:MAG: UDP-N-acetylmuramate dehydrogenase [Firmicutes bacterium]|nr:UDP-N-acetylmuramate dehydrogenase [Bacillota bacterium]MCM1400855.1 UDP-N-acetylmuramate dehydrogenase [Bacteroides sp.]MCM1476643.1 UDP-N-acetylmuramate dehydrogenase [Bacteroides sp.]